jgi:methyl-accepting chemotaxis protein
MENNDIVEYESVSTQSAVDEKTETFVAGTKEINEFINETSADILKDINKIFEGTEKTAIATDELAKGAVDNLTSIEQATILSQDIVQSAVATTGHVLSFVDILKQVDQTINNGHNMIKKQKESIDQNMEAVKQLVISMGNVKQMAAEIAGITKMMDRIALQTKILSLNASIEAARAGAQGRGFGVVAEEIGRFAIDSQNMATQIDKMVADINKAIKVANSNIETSESAVQNQEQVVDVISASFNTITQSVTEANSNINDILDENKALEESMKMVQSRFENIGAVSHQSAAATEGVSATVKQENDFIKNVILKAQELNNMAGELSIIIDTFENS